MSFSSNASTGTTPNKPVGSIKVVLSESPEGSPRASLPAVQPSPWFVGKRSWLCAGAVVVIVGLALGLGLGFGMPRHSNNTVYTAPVVTGPNTGQQAPSARNAPGIYYIAADEVEWAYTPRGDACSNRALEAVSPLVHPPDRTDGGVFTKAQYRAYTDATFTGLLDRPAAQAHLGWLGPLIQVEAGSKFRVMFTNHLKWPVNFEPMAGVTWAEPQGFLPPVAPGSTVTLNFTVLELPVGEQNSRLFLYHSSVDPTAHDNAGLVGPIIVTAKGQANPDGTTQGVDRDIVTLYQVIQENQSAYATANAGPLAASGPMKMTINGHMYCNSPNLDVVQGEKVRWHVASIGPDVTVHNFHWHGNTLLHDGHRVDHINVVGSNTASVDMVPDTVGSWLFHCHVNVHLTGGMVALYNVLPASNPPTDPTVLTGVTRTYYIAADEVMWNYAPSGGLMCNNRLEPFNEAAAVFLGEPNDRLLRVGSRALKAQYVQYTDASFTTRVARAPSDAYMGLLGPVIRADVGDEIQVVFKNQLRYYVSVHPHGVLYGKESEGAPYLDGSTQHGDDLVAPNTTYTYTWKVLERSGPGPKDPSSIMWLYHSHTDESADTNAGLVGAIVVNRAGAAPAKAPTASDPGAALPRDVDQDAFFWFTVMNEQDSIFYRENVQRALSPALWNTTNAFNVLTSNEAFLESSVKHMINGYMYCNMPKPTFTTYKRTRFHVIVMGSDVDVHAPTIGGGTFLTFGKHGASMAQLGGTMQTADVVFTDHGTFDMACRVADHILAGMHALYDVVPGTAPAAITGGQLRQYYIKAEKRDWDYAPNGYVKCTNKDQSEVARFFLEKTDTTIGSKRWKALFVPYFDSTFRTEKPRPAYQGLMGPMIAAEVGDTIEVTLKNSLGWPINFAPDGGLMALHNTTAGDRVLPGQTFTYRFVVPASAGPLPGDLSTSSYLYLSDVHLAEQSAAGLQGVMVIAAQGGLRPDGQTPRDVDVLLALHFQSFDENLSPFSEANIARLPPGTRDVLNPQTNHMASINGYMYCNMPPPTIPLGSKVRVIFSAFGSEEGVFSPRIMGQTLSVADGALQTQQLLAAVTVPSDLMADTAGTWPVLNDVHELLDGGMIGKVVVRSRLSSRRLASSQ